MRFFHVAQYVSALLCCICLVGFYRGPSPQAREHSGQAWGGACDDCDLELTEMSAGCKFLGDPEIMCFTHPGEEMGEKCDQQPCTDEVEEGNWQCPHAELRAYAHGATRDTTYDAPSVGTWPCYDDPVGSNPPEFCDCEQGVESGGSSQNLVDNLICFDIENCFTEVGQCFYNQSLGKEMCVKSGTDVEGSAPNTTPHPQFPCPTQADVTAALEDCRDQYGP